MRIDFEEVTPKRNKIKVVTIVILVILLIAIFGILGIYKSELSVVVLSFSVVLTLCAFLLFNLPKAKIFMGNIGSLLLGSGLVMMSIILHVEILLIFIEAAD